MKPIYSILLAVFTATTVLMGNAIYLQITEGGLNSNISNGILMGGNITLNCTLPTERPIMGAIDVTCPTITNSDQAKSYAIQLFPEFSDSTFFDSYPGKYIGITETEMLCVWASGTIAFSINTLDPEVPLNEFSIAEARSLSEAIIINHGGFGAFSEYCGNALEVTNFDNPSANDITGYSFAYYRNYEGYPVYGANAIKTIVGTGGPYTSPNDRTVEFYYRGVYQLNGLVESQQVISAATAWDSVTEETISDPLPINIEINQVCLCYYLENSKDAITRIYPAWQFSSEDIDIYINAFTGVYLG